MKGGSGSSGYMDGRAQVGKNARSISDNLIRSHRDKKAQLRNRTKNLMSFFHSNNDNTGTQFVYVDQFSGFSMIY